jgi:cell division protein FtsI (penicillin-binding protein 3)
VKHRDRWNQLGKILDLSPDYLDAILLPRAQRSFFYLKRHISPDVAVTLKAAGIPGVNLIDEYRRYYPSGEVTAHMLGFTNVDDRGQEGVELSFDSTLRGTKGEDLVIRDRLGRVVEHVERISDVQPGKDLALSIDRRLQYVAYRELKAAVQKHNADSGVMVVLDAETGEILAMVNAPSYNPNNRADAKREHFRNRTVTDLFEPGSTIKPFTVAAGLESGRYKPTTMIDTQGGQMRAGTVTVTDSHRAGMLSVTQVIQKSSNVGVTKIALAIEPELFWGVLNRAGFGQASGIDLPGERLVGVTVIGTGLPRLSLERDILQAHFEEKKGSGFDYAYRFPGMQRVLQAAGRLIRTETDKGSALLVDQRFLEPRHRVLFPSWWRISQTIKQ